MAEKDATARLRRAVKENNLFLVKRLIQRTDMRNPDSAPRRYTSLAWAAVNGNEETFEFLLNAGHDDEELSRDSENNTILMLLSDIKPPPPSQYLSQPQADDILGAALRMTRMYYDRYPWTLDWSNIHGKTSLHIAALKGNEELVRMLCDLGADVDLSDDEGNTPLHYASSWGHIPVVQILIERGCQFAARNNEGFTASDYAYSFSTMQTLQDAARVQFENSKRSRRHVFAQAAAKGSELGLATEGSPAAPGRDLRIRKDTARMRSGSGGSRTTATSDSGDLDSNGLAPSPRMNGQASVSTSSSPSQPSTHSANGSFPQHQSSNSSMHQTNGGYLQRSPGPSKPLPLPPTRSTSALGPIVDRMRERDADAIEKYRRNRSGSAGTASNSTDTKSQNGSTSNLSNGDGHSLSPLSAAGSMTPRRRLRPSMSAAQLRSATGAAVSAPQPPEPRSRSGTNPSMQRPTPISPLPYLARSSSTSASPRSLTSHDENICEEPEEYTGPPSQYAQFPEPPRELDSITPTRRLAFNILPKKALSGSESARGHRRGSSANSSRRG